MRWWGALVLRVPSSGNRFASCTEKDDGEGEGGGSSGVNGRSVAGAGGELARVIRLVC
jgi:hypothetical protein